MHGHISTQNGYLWVRLPDMLTPDGYARMREEIDKAIDGRPRRIVLDLAALDSIYSIALSFMIRLRKRVAETGGYLCLVNVSDRCGQFLGSVQLHRVFRAYPSEAAFHASDESEWRKRLSADDIGFVMVKQLEESIMRITLAGKMTALQDLTPLHQQAYREGVERYLFDFSGLDLLDSAGAALLTRSCGEIRDRGGQCAGFGCNELVADQLSIMSVDKLISCYDTQKEALGALGS
jgi:anti-anti-sigma factor